MYKIADNVNRFKVAMQALKERKPKLYDTVLRQPNFIECEWMNNFAENLNHFQAAIQVIKECQGQDL